MALKGLGSRGFRWTPIIQCAWCRAIRVGDRYVVLPWLGLVSRDWGLSLFGHPLIKISVTHSVCDRCARAIAARARAERARREHPIGVEDSIATHRLSVRIDRLTTRVSSAQR